MSDQKKPRGRPRKTEPTTPIPAGLQCELPVGALLTALRGTEHAIPKKTTLPVLTFFGVEGVGEQVTVTATDLERAVWRTVKAQVGAPGKICLPGITPAILAGLAEATPAKIQVTAKTATAQVSVGKVTAALKGIDGSEFPLIGTSGLAHAVTAQFSRAQLKQIIAQVSPFAASDESRPVLNGVHVKFNYPVKDDPASTVTVVAADGYRAAELTLFDVRLTFTVAEGWERSVIIPPGLFVEALRLANENGEDECLVELRVYLEPSEVKEKDGTLKTIYTGNGVVTVVTEHGGLQFSLIEGMFPKVESVLGGADFDKIKVIPLPVEDTLGALARASKLAAESMDTVRVACDVQANTTTITAVSPDSGDVVERLSTQFNASAPAQDFTIGLNAKYFASLIKAVAWNDGAQPAQMLVTSPKAPAFFKIPGYRSAVMPVHLNTGEASEPEPEPVAVAPTASTAPVAILPTVQTVGESAAQTNATEQEAHVRLVYTEPPSNKEYRLELVPLGGKWSVDFAFGRIGGDLKTGTKTPTPLDYAEALKMYNDVLAEKRRGGYVIEDNTAPAAPPDQPIVNSAGQPVTCVCGKTLIIVAGGADMCACGKIVDETGTVIA